MPATRLTGLFGVLARSALPICILAAGTGAYSILSNEPEKPKSPPVEKQDLRTKVTELRITDYPVVIKTHGIVQAHNEVSISAEVPGLITHVSPSFEVGSYFSEGEILVELDAQDYTTALALAEAQLLGARAALQLARQVHEQNLKLVAKDVVSETEVSQTSAALAQAEAQLDSATAGVEQAQRNLERTKIRAPFDGRVRQKAIGLGQSVGLGTPLGVVFAVDFAEVRLPIAGRELQFLDLPELAGDRPVEVTLRDAVGEASSTIWKAKIVRTEGALDADSLELFAIARIDDPFGLKSGEPPLRIGQPVEGSIVGKTLTGVAALPRAAVRQLDKVYLVDQTELTLSSKTIEPIWSDEEHVFVRDASIRDGSWLSTTHLVYAPDGAKVEIIPEVESGPQPPTQKTSAGAAPVAKSKEKSQDAPKRPDS